MTREEAIERLKEWEEVISSGHRKAVINMAIDALNQTAWVPVGERLPEVGERVLVTKRVTRFRNETHIARYNVTRWCSFGTISNKNIVAWMPLPKPYKGGDE